MTLETTAPQTNTVVAPASPLFVVATHKFIVLSICTFGLYELYWCYQHWKKLQQASGENLRPFWRALFAPIFNFALFERIEEVAKDDEVLVGWDSRALALAFLIVNVGWRLPGAWWLVSMASFVPLIPVQKTAQSVNERYIALNPGAGNARYSSANILTIIFGGVFLLLALVGTFMGD